MNCGNCKARLSCGCQKRTASDGTSVCTKCQNDYELKLKNRPMKHLTQPPVNYVPSGTTAPVVNGVKVTQR